MIWLVNSLWLFADSAKAAVIYLVVMIIVLNKTVWIVSSGSTYAL